MLLLMLLRLSFLVSMASSFKRQISRSCRLLDCIFCYNLGLTVDCNCDHGWQGKEICCYVILGELTSFFFKRIDFCNGCIEEYKFKFKVLVIIILEQHSGISKRFSGCFQKVCFPKLDENTFQEEISPLSLWIQKVKTERQKYLISYDGAVGELQTWAVNNHGR